MYIKNVEIEKLSNSQALANIMSSKEISAKTAYKFAIFMKSFMPVMKIYQETKQNLFEKYCDKDENGMSKIIDNQYYFTDNRIIFNKEFSELLDDETQMDFVKIKLSINDFPSGLLSINDMLSLDTIIEFTDI
jgi:hypothetical protein